MSFVVLPMPLGDHTPESHGMSISLTGGPLVASRCFVPAPFNFVEGAKGACLQRSSCLGCGPVPRGPGVFRPSFTLYEPKVVHCDVITLGRQRRKAALGEHQTTEAEGRPPDRQQLATAIRVRDRSFPNLVGDGRRFGSTDNGVHEVVEWTLSLGSIRGNQHSCHTELDLGCTH
ncbi:hypothetical protein OHR86_20540 [Streptomyces sp. NBC_00441]|uniref:hypothetical protein n=1 Tax=Streptomyces sp. NBC_00441 TaxID=2975742 RepID=UPI002E2E2185|nr:hypothetical protein [Streptomyces sp. NBC_00441]